MSRHTLDATSKLVRDIGRMREEVQQQLTAHMRILLLPLVEQIRKARAMEECNQAVDLLTSHIEDIMSGLTMSMQINTPLSLREVRIALMVKCGLTNEEIAPYLQIRPETVKTHRRNIRKKLELTGSPLELNAYLQTLAYNDLADETDQAP